MPARSVRIGNASMVLTFDVLRTIDGDAQPKEARAVPGRAGDGARCQPVAFMIVAMVAPCGRWSISITLTCFESLRPGLAD